MTDAEVVHELNVAGQYSAIFSQQAEMIADLRATLAERDELIFAQNETITALRVEIHLLRKRYGLTPEVIQELMGLVGV